MASILNDTVELRKSEYGPRTRPPRQEPPHEVLYSYYPDRSFIIATSFTSCGLSMSQHTGGAWQLCYACDISGRDCTGTVVG